MFLKQVQFSKSTGCQEEKKRRKRAEWFLLINLVFIESKHKAYYGSSK